MIKITIDNREYEVKEGISILEACRENNIDIPTLCYLKDINEIAACKMCLVKVEGIEGFVASCNTKVFEGMNIITTDEEIEKARKINLELILSEHNTDCDNCNRDGTCALQKLKYRYQITDDIPYEVDYKETYWNDGYSFIKDNAKCIKCMRCVQVCDKIQSLNIWNLKNNGTRTEVGLREDEDIFLTKCVSCGQCVSYCPTGALMERDDADKFLEAISSSKKVVVQIAPAVRTAFGEELGLTKEECTINKIAAVLKDLGVDYVFDTNFTADLTIMEEANEFLERIDETKEYPMFTSCCPGWVSFIKKEYPDMVHCLSSAKSPQQMMGSVIKTYFAKKANIDPKDIYSVSIMPCIAKKLEKDLPGMESNEGIKDVDLVLTNRELIRLVKKKDIDVSALEDIALDDPLCEGTGAAVIFGATGGVMEAALRSAYKFVTNEEAPKDSFKLVRGPEGIKKAKFNINGIDLDVAVVNGLGNARRLIERIRNKEVHYNFVEVMACPQGCVGGGGQPRNDDQSIKLKRSAVLYNLDEANEKKASHQNEGVNRLYEEEMDKPLSEKAHHNLHVEHIPES